MNGNVEEVLNRHWPWSAWLTIVVSLAIVAAIAWLYWNQRGHTARWRLGLLTTLRVAAIFLVFWMLAGWSIERYQTDLPDLAIVVDDSASMQTADGLGTSTGSDARASRWDSIQKVLRSAWSGPGATTAGRYRVKLFTISEQTQSHSLDPALESTLDQVTQALSKQTPDGQQSRLGDGLSQVLQRQSGRPTAAVVIFSDGIVTEGAPLSESIAQARRAGVPIYCVATGEQLPQPDLAMLDLLADDAVYLGDRVNVQVTVAATDVDKHRATINMRDMQSGQVVDSVQVEFDAQRSSANAQLSYVPKTPGNSVIKLEVVAAPGEKNLDNNSLERVIEVRDQTLRVLLVQRTPGFEYRFLKTLLERTSNLADPDKRAFKVDAVLQDADAAHVSQDANALRLVPGDAETIAAYDVIVIGQVDPSLVASSTQQMIVDQVTRAGTGIIFVCHPDFNEMQMAGWPFQRLLPIDMQAAQARSVPRPWQYDGVPQRWKPTALGQSALPLQLANPGSSDALWSALPGPEWYYRPSALKPGAQVLATAQAEGSSATGSQSPLLITQFVGAGRVVMQTNDETYRWQGFRGSELVYERYWIQMLRWLARGKLNRQNQTELVVEPRRARLGEPLQFLVRLNPQLAADLDTSDCELTIQRIGGQARQLSLSRAGGAAPEFKATETQLPAGSYRATLSRPVDSSLSAITFTITAPPGEQANLRSDWRGLQALAEQTHGRFAAAAQADTLLRQLPKGTPVRRGALPSVPIWNTSWVALAFVLIISLEWILRRTANML